MDVKDVKKEYEKFIEKYNLPSFNEINEDFEVDKIDRESDCFLRAVRKAIMEKIVNAIGFLEMLLNPMNAPRMYVPFVNTMAVSDNKEIDELYNSLSELSLLSLKLEMGYSEKGEAEVIRKVFDVWQKEKVRFGNLVDKIGQPVNSVKRERSYFG